MNKIRFFAYCGKSVSPSWCQLSFGLVFNTRTDLRDYWWEIDFLRWYWRFGFGFYEGSNKGDKKENK